MPRQYLLRTFIKVNTNGILHNSTTAISKKGRPAINTEEKLSKNPILSVLDLKAETDTRIEIIKPIKTAITSTVQARRIRNVE
tara:strand:- start:13 stop:261 length:249 start_codon:yes stop_codon:yes gene_type:complete